MSQTLLQNDTSTELREPSLYNVIYINDDQTAVEFVIDTLTNFFKYNVDTATQITENIHNNGRAVVAVLPFEIAEQKGIEVTVLARAKQYPLMVKLEPEETT